MLKRRVGLRGRVVTVICALVATNTAAFAQARPDPLDSLLGRWEIKGGWTSDAVSTIIELMAGGWYSHALVASSRLRYDYNGADLFLMSLSSTGQPDSSTRRLLSVRFDGDTLTATSARDTIRMLRARGGEFPGDIRGRWLLLNQDPAKPIAEEFSDDGYVKVMATLNGEVGRYRIVGDEIEWEPKIPSGRAHRTKFKVSKDRLQLSVGKMSDELVRLR